MPAGETPPDRPITLLATAIPRLISLAVAANVLHILPAAVLDAAIGNDVLGTLDLTAAGSLHRCHQALEAHARTEGYDADEWLPLAYEQAADWLEHASARSRSASADRPRPTGRPLRRARDRLARPQRAELARGDNRHPRPPPHRLRVRRRRSHRPPAQVTRLPAASMHAATQAGLGSRSESAKPIAALATTELQTPRADRHRRHGRGVDAARREFHHAVAFVRVIGTAA